MRILAVLVQDFVPSVLDEAYTSGVLLVWLGLTSVFMPTCACIDSLLSRDCNFLEATQMLSVQVGDFAAPALRPTQTILDVYFEI